MGSSLLRRVGGRRCSKGFQGVPNGSGFLQLVREELDLICVSAGVLRSDQLRDPGVLTGEWRSQDVC